jgi:hypothetical protein
MAIISIHYRRFCYSYFLNLMFSTIELGKRSELRKSERWKPKRTSKKFQSIRTSKVFKKVMRTSKLIDSVQNRFKSDLIDYWIKVFKIDVKKIYFRRFLFGVANCPGWSKSEMQWSKQKWNFTIERKSLKLYVRSNEKLGERLILHLPLV